MTQDDVQWISGRIKPAEPGWYQCQYLEERVPGPLYWTGEMWRRGAPWNHASAFGLRDGDKWRVFIRAGETCGGMQS